MTKFWIFLGVLVALLAAAFVVNKYLGVAALLVYVAAGGLAAGWLLFPQPAFVTRFWAGMVDRAP
jgi:hypothetical protein